MRNCIWRYKSEYLPTYCVPNRVRKSAITNMATGKIVDVLFHIVWIDKMLS